MMFSTLMGRFICAAFVAVTFCGLHGVRAAQAADLTLELSAGDFDRDRTPVMFELPEALRDIKTFSLKRTEGGNIIPAQQVDGDPPSLVWMLDEPLPAGATRRYLLSTSLPQVVLPAGMMCDEDEGTVHLRVGDHDVLTYHTAVVQPPEGLDPRYRRSGFIHPLRTPSGAVVTEDFPADHAHQHGVFFAWVDTTFEGRPVDFWNQAKGTGTVEHVRVNRCVGGPVFSELDVTLRYVDLSAPGGPKPVLNEDWTLRVYNRDDQFLIDVESWQQCASESPLVLNEYHYGGMAWRGPTAWLGKGHSEFYTSGGQRRADGNHTRPEWVEAHGLIDGFPAGITLLQHPENFRYPQPVRLHPDKPYFVLAPEVLGEFSIDPGQTYTSRYRLVLEDGPPHDDIAQQGADALPAWSDYAHPPMVKVVPAEKP